MSSLKPNSTALCAPLVLPGTWELPARQAICLQPRAPGLLRVRGGRIWATTDGPHSGPANDLGDRVIEAGGQLRLAAGQRWVIEGLDARAPAYFSWEPAPRALPGWRRAWLAWWGRFEHPAAGSGAAA